MQALVSRVGQVNRGIAMPDSQVQACHSIARSYNLPTRTKLNAANRRARLFTLYCLLPNDAATPAAPSTAAASDRLQELNQENFYAYLESQQDTLVVVDFYTDWCGPCKVIYPELVKLARERPDIRIVKFNCNKTNKDLGVKLGIKVAPTFQLYRNSVKVAEMTGAKIENLVALIDKALGQAADLSMS